MCGSVRDATHSSSFLRNIIESRSLFVLLFWRGVLITRFPSIEMGGEVSVLACLFVGVVGLLRFFVYCYRGYYILEDLRLGYFVGLFSAFVISMCFLLLREGSWSLVLF
jgi:NADH:ubiquinone oxidoreductase subunit 5 (subunit L)/multisubunit Na+/H+ antiporter MnhA subunit